jgi:TIR domain
MATPTRRDRIFISYRRADSAGHAGRLEDDLARLLGDRMFMDVSDIAPGTDFETVLRGELASCGVVLAVIGPRWLEAFGAAREGQDYVHLELALALASEAVQVVPVLMQGASLPASGKLPADLQALGRRQAAFIRDDRWKDDVNHLARGLREALKLSRFRKRWIVAGAAVLATLALFIALSVPPAPAAFSRSRAHEITVAATIKAARACKPAAGVIGDCPVGFRFAQDGSTEHVWFDSGSCRYSAPTFGDCLLKRLAGVRIPPFDNVDGPEVALGLRMHADGSAKVIIEF